MVKHFEELWEETEFIANKLSPPDPQKDLHLEIDKLFFSEEKEKSFGKILYLLCYLSFHWKVNTFTVLLKEMQDRKIELFEY